MPHTSEIPLHVYQVLEEEYVSLHGPLEERDVVSLPDDGGGRRMVVARRDWRFHRGHVKDPKGLALRLLPSLADEFGEAAGEPPESAKRRGPRRPEEVSAYLASKIPAETLRDVYRFAGPFSARPDDLFEDGPEPAARARDAGADDEGKARARKALGELEAALDALLADASLYDRRAFAGVVHTDATRALVNHAVPRSGRGTTYGDPDDIAHFNRLLLEDVFPEELERVHNVRLAAVQKQFHRQRQSALCLSGGGTRSGTFALGLIQGLARHNLLKGFDYLSTVSGGGYIGGWLTAWLHRHREGLPGVTEELRRATPRSKIDPDPEPIRYLRQYSNFITPKVGLLSADTWAFVGIYLRNLLLNWAVIIPLALGVLALPRLYVSTIMRPLSWEWAHLTEAARATRAAGARRFWSLLPPAFESRHWLLVAGFVLAVFAVAFIGFNRPQQREQLRLRSPFWYRHTGQLSFLVCCLAPLVLGAFCLTVYWAWSLYAWRGETKPWPSYFFFGAALTFCGWLLSSVVLGRFGRDYWRGLKRHDRFALATEFVALLLAGGVGALLFKLAENAESPIVAYVGQHWTTWRTELYAWLAVPGFLTAALLAMTLFIGLTSHFALFTDEDREWWARAGAWFLIAIIAWLAFCGLVVFGPLVLLAFPKIMASAGGISGLASLLAGRSARTSGDKQKDEGGLLSSTANLLLPVLAGLFLAIFIALLSLLTSLAVKLITDLVAAYYTTPPRAGLPAPLTWVTTVYPLTWADPSLAATHLRTVHYSPWWLSLALVVVPFAVGLLAARLINLNRFSLHAGYRDRLIRGFLGASRGPGRRRPNPFTGFDPADNIRMHELRPSLLHEADFQNFAGLARALRRAADPFSAYLYENYLDPTTRALLDSYNPEAQPPQALKVALVEDLNEALETSGAPRDESEKSDAPLYDALDRKDHPLYQAEPFVTLRRDAAALNVLAVARRSPHSTYALFLNRLILQTAYPDLVRAKYPPPHRLLHVVNTALNLVGGNNLAWQQRKAEPFSVSPLHAGCFRLGYRRARDYGGEDGISLGTSVAISGAAASSNMGYYTSSPVLAMVMTLFNVRLGWWLGNPGPAGYKTYRRQSPIFSIAPVVYEAFGLTDDTSKYVYLTDGGHFENLALYEMVLRRCHVIVMSDAAADPDYQFNDLGNAVRKIRIDLGVPIEFREMPIHGGSPGDKGAGLYWAVARVRYGCVDEGAEDGVLVYVKPAVYGAEPQDVLHYKKAHSAFPHESTADQFFDEPQFESYRMLGSHIADRALGDGTNDLDLRAAVAALYWRDRPRWPDINAPWLERHRPKDGEG